MAEIINAFTGLVGAYAVLRFVGLLGEMKAPLSAALLRWGHRTIASKGKNDSEPNRSLCDSD